MSTKIVAFYVHKLRFDDAITKLQSRYNSTPSHCAIWKRYLKHKPAWYLQFEFNICQFGWFRILVIYSKKKGRHIFWYHITISQFCVIYDTCKITQFLHARLLSIILKYQKFENWKVFIIYCIRLVCFDWDMPFESYISF